MLERGRMSEYSNIQDAATTTVKGLNAYEGEIPLVFFLIHLQIFVKKISFHVVVLR